jgi:hypothetical protein
MPAEQKGRNAAAAATLKGCNAPGDLRTAVGKPPIDRVQRRKSRHSPASLEGIDGVFAAGKEIIITASGSSGHTGLVGDVYDCAALNGCHVGHPRNLAKTALTE